MQKKSESRNLAENTIAFGIGTLGAKLVMFFLLPVYTTYMTQAELGIAELIVSTVSLLFPLATLTITSAQIRFSMEKQNNKGDVIRNSILVTVLGVSAVSFLIYIVPFSSSLKEWKGYLCLLLFTDAIRRIFSVFLKAENRTMLFSVDCIFYTIVLFILNLIFLIGFDLGTVGYISAAILADLCSTIFLIVTGKTYRYIKIKQIDRRLLHNMVVFSLPLIVNGMSWWIANSSDKFILEYLRDEAAVGIYSVATKLPALLTTFASMFLQAWSLSAISAYENNESEAFYKKIWNIFSGGLFIGAAILIASIKFIMGFLVGKEFGTAWMYVPLLVVGAIYNDMGAFFADFYIAVKKNTKVMATTIGGAVINIILNIVLIPVMGIQGATFSTAVTYLLVWLYRMADTRRIIKFNVGWRKVITSSIILYLEILSVLRGYFSILISFGCIAALLFMYRETVRTIYAQICVEARRICRKE